MYFPQSYSRRAFRIPNLIPASNSVSQSSLPGEGPQTPTASGDPAEPTSLKFRLGTPPQTGLSYETHSSSSLMPSIPMCMMSRRRLNGGIGSLKRMTFGTQPAVSPIGTSISPFA